MSNTNSQNWVFSVTNCHTTCVTESGEEKKIRGSLVVPATSEFVQILNTGSHWVCLSTISTTPGTGTVKICHSMYQKPNSIAVQHACRMLLMCPGSKVTFINEKVQRQVGGSDCGLFSLAFATDLCHGLDPVHL